MAEYTPREEPPEYRVYRSRKPGLLSRLRGGGSLPGLRDRARRRRGAEPEPGARKRITPWRIFRWLIYAVLAWILVSVALFFLSATLNQGLEGDAENALEGGSNLFAGSTILVIGSDQRPKGTKEPGAGGPGRADSILLLRASFGQVRRVSILRDSYAEIPGHGGQKINAAYALGGTGLMVDTVEQFMGNGLTINHVIEIDFENFPRFIDSMGGIDVELAQCVRSPPFSGRPFNLPAGKRHLNGRRALAFARVRKNLCAPNEDDRARARRQQQVLQAVRTRLVSPQAFIRLPWVAWSAPRAVESDLAGPGMFALFVDVMTGGTGKTTLLEPAGAGPGGSLSIAPSAKAEAVRHLRGRD